MYNVPADDYVNDNKNERKSREKPNIDFVIIMFKGEKKKNLVRAQRKRVNI